MPSLMAGLESGGPQQGVHEPQSSCDIAVSYFCLNRLSLLDSGEEIILSH